MPRYRILFGLLCFGYFLQICFAVKGHLILKNKHQQSSTDEEIEDEIYEDAEYLEYQDVMRTSNQGALTKESVFEQGEMRDFLYFLKRIGYDHRQCPIGPDDEPVHVYVSVVVSNVRAVSEVTMDASYELFFREFWLDSRLQYDKQKFKNKSEIALHESYANFLWHPDTFMPNAITSKNPRKQSISHRSLLRLQEDGNVLYSRRLSIVAECPMDLTLFPFDSQVCKLGIESYGHTADKVQYHWSKKKHEALKLHKIRLPDFTIKEAYVTRQVVNYATGNYSRLYVCFVFTRSAGFCFLQLIIPSTAVVITSWVSLWMENETSFQDMISIILTITFLLFSYNEVMPRVSYIKAMDVYLGVCFMIVFLSLIKLAIVKYMRQRLRITRDTSIVAGMMPMLRIANGLTMNPKTPPLTSILAQKQPTSSSPSSSAAAARNNSAKFTFPNQPHSTTIDGFGPMSMRSTLGNKKKQRCWEVLDNLPQVEFSAQFMRRFHWMSQMTFFFGFVLFCLFYFLVYPNIHSAVVDPACIREDAEWFASVI